MTNNAAEQLEAFTDVIDTLEKTLEPYARGRIVLHEPQHASTVTQEDLDLLSAFDHVMIVGCCRGAKI